jgi:protein-disulfide isomerase/uncharacterized membrane protein
MVAEAETSTTGATGRWLIVVAATAIGFADSVYLLYVHISIELGREVAGFCDVSATLNCRAAVGSDYAVVFGLIPVPVLAIGFYAGMMVLILRSRAKVGEPDSDWLIVVTGFSAALIYSMFLLSVMLWKLDALCPGCLVLDAVNLIGVTSAVLLLRGTSRTQWPGVGGLAAAGAGSAGLVFLLTFSAAVGLGLFATTAYVGRQPVEVSVDAAYEQVVGYPQRHEIAGVDSAPSIGDENAPIQIVEFSDFECPYCGRLRTTLEELRALYPEILRVRYMNYPLNTDCNSHVNGSLHDNACIAARAAVCAQEQGQFWPMHDLMFDNNTHLERDSLIGFAGRIGIDVGAFEFCLDGRASAERVAAETDAAFAAVEAVGLDGIGTPFFFLNGLLLRGAKPTEVIEALIQRELQELEGTGDAATP